ncbi:MAG: S8 family serine peptidase [Oscillospiraceae bacterium]|nr:S8 family serine peptidase [Oscillospiraceae bacterium]
MKRTNRCTALLLSLSLGLSLSLPAAAVDSAPLELPAPVSTEQVSCPYSDQESVRVMVLMETDGAAEAKPLEADSPEFHRKQAALEGSHQKLRQGLKASGIEYTLEYDYTALLSGMSMTISYGDLETVKAMPEVQDAWIVTTYELPQPEDVPEEELSGDSLQAYSALPSEAGQGMLIATLDSGTNVTHEAFGVYPEVLGEPAISGPDEISSLSLPGAYVSEKIPYVYDYGDKDTDVTDVNGHGTHVSGTAAGYVQSGDGTTKFSGTAPGAQLAVMKIFRDDATTTTTDVYFAALEDAYLLGADVVNMSIGTAAGFVHDATLESQTFGNIYKILDEAGIIVCAAAGNYRSQASGNSVQPGTVSPAYSDYGTVASPSTYIGNISVAASTGSDSGSAIASFSAWGATSGLTIAPEISAPGQNILSAGIDGTDSYRSSSGTSMASPAAAGSYAVLSGSLSRQFPGLSKLRRAALAEVILSGSAQTLGSLDDPISVRQQGAGVMDLSEALASDFAVTTALSELSDDPDRTGVYTVEVTVEQLRQTARDCAAVRFTDVSESSWYHRAVDYACGTGLFYGTSDTTFSPNQVLTRGQLVAILYRHEGSPAVTGTSGFADVPQSQYYAKAVTWARQRGIVAGISDELFAPNAPVTREQLAAILYRYSGKPATTGDLDGFSDQSQVSSYARTPIAWAVGLGIISGVSTTTPTLAPRQSATRAQLASMVCRLFGDTEVTAVFTPSAEVFGDSISPESGRNHLDSAALDFDVSFSAPALEFHTYTDKLTITATITLSDSCKASIDAQFPYGTFVEGFIRLGSSTEVPLHSTFLGFYGDWTEAPILEQTDFRDTLAGTAVPELTACNAQLYCANPSSSYYRKTLAVLGKNPFGSTPYSQARMALSSASAESNYAGQLLIRPVLLRNARALTLTVSDASTGKVYLKDQRSYVHKSTFSSSSLQWRYPVSFYFAPQDSTGTPLPDGTELLFTFSASLNGEPETVQWQFPCLIDAVAPEISAQRSDDRSSVTITVRDSQYLSILKVSDSSGNTLYQQLYSDESPNVPHTITLDCPDPAASLSIVAVDYATNIGRLQVN